MTQMALQGHEMKQLLGFHSRCAVGAPPRGAQPPAPPQPPPGKGDEVAWAPRPPKNAAR